MNPLRVALILAALCGVAAWQVGVIPESLMQMTLGPRWCLRWWWVAWPCSRCSTA